MDSGWALEQLRLFIHLTDQVGYDNSGGGVLIMGTHLRAPRSQVAQQVQVIEHILDRVVPTWRHEPGFAKETRDLTYRREWAGRAIAQIERQAELTEKLGDGAPMLDVGQLHPWVWDAVRPLWGIRLFGKALSEAGIHINAHTQSKVGRRDASEGRLLRESFSVDAPKEGQPRLRLMDDDGGDTFRSIHIGAGSLAVGLFAAVRNPNSHELIPDLQEQVALEQLAAWSVLARWVSDAKVVRASAEV